MVVVVDVVAVVVSVAVVVVIKLFNTHDDFNLSQFRLKKIFVHNGVNNIPFLIPGTQFLEAIMEPTSRKEFNKIYSLSSNFHRLTFFFREQKKLQEITCSQIVKNKRRIIYKLCSILTGN